MRVAERKLKRMLSDALVFALFAYALAFAIALLTAGIIKVIQLGTSLGSAERSSSSKPEAKQ